MTSRRIRLTLFLALSSFVAASCLGGASSEERVEDAITLQPLDIRAADLLAAGATAEAANAYEELARRAPTRTDYAELAKQLRARDQAERAAPSEADRIGSVDEGGAR